MNSGILPKFVLLCICGACFSFCGWLRLPAFQHPVVTLDARPCNIRDGKQERSVLKLARKKVHKHVADLAVSFHITTAPSHDDYRILIFYMKC